MTAFQLPPSALTLAGRRHAELRGEWEALTAAPTAVPVEVETLHARTALASAPAMCGPVPPDLQGCRAELIVEASDLDMLRWALDAVVIDFDDTSSPTLDNVRAVYGALSWVAASDRALLVRPRPLYAAEPHLTFGGQPGIAALCDLSAVLAARCWWPKKCWGWRRSRSEPAFRLKRSPAWWMWQPWSPSCRRAPIG